MVLIPLLVDYPFRGLRMGVLASKRIVLIPLLVDYPFRGCLKMAYNWRFRGLNPSSSGLPIPGPGCLSVAVSWDMVLIPLLVDYPFRAAKAAANKTYGLVLIPLLVDYPFRVLYLEPWECPCSWS